MENLVSRHFMKKENYLFAASQSYYDGYIRRLSNAIKMWYSIWT